MVRPSWQDYFMAIAKAVASRSTCKRASCGAVIVKDNRILATGYNGSLPGEPHCTEADCLMINEHCERTIHAETNAVAQAAKFGVNINGSTLYCWSVRFNTGLPVEFCTKCVQVMRSAGIIRIVNNYCRTELIGK